MSFWQMLTISSGRYLLGFRFSFSILCLLLVAQQSKSNIFVDGMLLASSSQHYTRFVDPLPSQRDVYTRRYQQQFEQPQRYARYGQNSNNNNNNNHYINNNNAFGNGNTNDNYQKNTVYRNRQAVVSPNHGYQHESSLSHTRLAPLRPNSSLEDRSRQHKCRIWVPTEAVAKYAWASKLPADPSSPLQPIEICCRGYAPIRWRGSTLCRPLCDNCQNGLCIAPGVCQCYEEFVKNDNGDCVFTCPLGCLNGRCYLDGSCQCDAGYKLDETRKFCRPICSNGCSLNRRHNCTEPEVCGCAAGYRLTNNLNDCQPTCNPDCGVGGICREPNTCECGIGYTLKDGACQSECYQKCDNGICYGRNRCICNPGFSYHEKSTQCIPA